MSLITHNAKALHIDNRLRHSYTSRVLYIAFVIPCTLASLAWALGRAIGHICRSNHDQMVSETEKKVHIGSLTIIRLQSASQPGSVYKVM
jgi:hypothetical protein